MVPDLIWVPKKFGSHGSWYGMKMLNNDIHAETKFLGAQTSQRPNFLETKLLGADTDALLIVVSA